MTKIVGIDLAGMPKNDTGFCILEIEENIKKIKTKILHSDDEILKNIESEIPDLICIDGPTTRPLRNQRKCDIELRKYGALPPLLGGMRYLTMRASKLRENLEKTYKIIEVYPRASSKILGFYNEDEIKMQKELVKLGLEGDIVRRSLSKDEIEGVVAALTGYLYLQGKTKEVGDHEGKIIIPKL